MGVHSACWLPATPRSLCHRVGLTGCLSACAGLASPACWCFPHAVSRALPGYLPFLCPLLMCLSPLCVLTYRAESSAQLHTFLSPGELSRACCRDTDGLSALGSFWPFTRGTASPGGSTSLGSCFLHIGILEGSPVRSQPPESGHLPAPGGFCHASASPSPCSKVRAECTLWFGFPRHLPPRTVFLGPFPYVL